MESKKTERRNEEGRLVIGDILASKWILPEYRREGGGRMRREVGEENREGKRRRGREIPWLSGALSRRYCP